MARLIWIPEEIELTARGNWFVNLVPARVGHAETYHSFCNLYVSIINPPINCLQTFKSNETANGMITDKTKLKLDREVGGGCFFLFQVFRCFINLIAKQFDVLFVCVSVCVFHSLFLFLSGDLSSRLWRRLTDGC